MPPRPVPELLAPAGNLETAVAACDAGADAVYCGLANFNARERAENFAAADLHRLIDFAHAQGRKVYVTFNTLVFESELPEAFAALNDLKALKPDALIVQDPGIMMMLRRYFPELALHVSTQAGIHNLSGVRAAARLGARRVILERQLTLAELRKIAGASPVELEVFIHGSLCCSLSGRCLFSHYLYGGSGNRGRCKQPCRMRYEGGFPLSPSDLCGVDVLAELRKLGVASLKIEGRLRPPEYVWKSVRAYRMLLDAAPGDYAAVRSEAQKLLDSAAGRSFSTGFFDPAAWPKLIDPKRRGSFGIPAAKVEEITTRGAVVRVLARMHLGDRMRPVTPEGGEGGDSFSLTALESGGRARMLAAAGCRCLLPGASGLRPGWMLYKIGENGFDFSRRARALPPGRFAVDFALDVTSSGWRGRLAACPQNEWRCDQPLKAARNCALESRTVAAEFASGVPEPYRAGAMQITVAPGLFLPASELKLRRREFWAWAAAQLAALPLDEASRQRFAAEYRATAASQAAFPSADYVVPPFLPEGEAAAERDRIQAAYQRGARRFGVTGWHALELLRPYPDAELILTFPFFVANSLAAQAAERVVALEAVPELPDAELTALAQHTVLPVRRAPEAPLLVSRLELPDPGSRFKVVRRGGTSELYFASGRKG